MGVTIFKKEDQANGNFNNGEIIEKKPIGFSQDGGELKPYSNLFYWAHAWTSSKKSMIGLHPHKGFEICSFVLKGNINHFDTKQNKWIPLSEGDVQIIRSGNGISHAEEIDKNSEIFQIWFDPNLKESLQKEASYDDYKSEVFKEKSSENKTIKFIAGNNSPMRMDTEGILINEYKLNKGKHTLKISSESIHSLFLYEGSLKYKESLLKKGAFLKVENTNKISFEGIENSRIFEIISPQMPSYNTYS